MRVIILCFVVLSVVLLAGCDDPKARQQKQEQTHLEQLRGQLVASEAAAANAESKASSYRIAVVAVGAVAIVLFLVGTVVGAGARKRAQQTALVRRTPDSSRPLEPNSHPRED